MNFTNLHEQIINSTTGGQNENERAHSNACRHDCNCKQFVRNIFCEHLELKKCIFRNML